MVVPAAEAVLSTCDEEFVTDLRAVLSSVIYGSLSRFAAGTLEIADVVPTIDRAVYWLTRSHDTVAR